MTNTEKKRVKDVLRYIYEDYDIIYDELEEVYDNINERIEAMSDYEVDMPRGRTLWKEQESLEDILSYLESIKDKIDDLEIF